MGNHQSTEDDTKSEMDASEWYVSWLTAHMCIDDSQTTQEVAKYGMLKATNTSSRVEDLANAFLDFRQQCQI